MTKDRTHARRSGDAGFTLLEIIVVTLVFALLSTALWQGSAIGVRGWALEQKTFEHMSDLQSMEDALRRIVTRSELSDPGLPPAFTGVNDRLSLISWLPQQEGYAHEIEAGIGVDAKHRLVLRWRPYRRARCAGAEQAFHEEVLARDIQAISFSYYGRKESFHGWQSNWSRPELPLLVRIHIVTMTPGVQWPDMLIHPSLSGAESS
ncbi:prepilin-type N-terminal cleavage/methylation domain-containing protein [Acetobacter sp. DsW_063]|uniref:prepilin-type N-terminal cleavage/methylation domain-containing protein n=1 Tax=Acetobacter sp. DsW_063 TaxID=1514894 RepID=UPI000A377AF1|nr:prepilin-type N-terminal cleavage/methylation domain-containing protein [Acetobacter sp. DsW_063]